MSWDHDNAVRYDRWAKSPRGSFALRQEIKLLQGVIAPWPRRKQKLLDIGCGTGMFLEFFWSCGFDLTGMDKSPDMLSLAREKIGLPQTMNIICLGALSHLLPFMQFANVKKALAGVLPAKILDINIKALTLGHTQAKKLYPDAPEKWTFSLPTTMESEQ